ncbi:MAG: PQQ-dependent sugar dehydrogenase, partial [Bacteroidota bacterium]|nr:PQQ-dependent sugar dehydrogenase [Bacteroidota bacterium]
YYTVKDEDHNRISRFTADGNYVVPGSELVLVNIDPLLGTIHNAGSMAFGPDEKLYVSIGEGADGPKAQNMNSLLGKVIRINPDGSIPSDNPFYNTANGIYRAIYALGFRNSFSMSIQRGTGRIFATEVGASTWEEVNEILPGMNYGWPIIEGPINGQTPPPNYKDPVFSYNHNDGCAAVGAAFYNPDINLFPAIYAGKFFFADYCDGYVKFMDPNVPGIAAVFATEINRPLNLLTATDGSMYYLARAGLGGGSEQDNTASNDGTLWQIFYSGSNAPFVSVNPQSILISEGEDARFFIAASGEQPLFYQWQKDGVDIPGADTSFYIFTNAMLSDSGSLFRCIVQNLNGADTSLAAVLKVTADKRPEPVIITPAEGTMYRAGDILFFSGEANDPDQGLLPAGNLKWKIDFHHNVHTHPALIPTSGITEGEYLIPVAGETSDDVWYSIHLTATDDQGLSKTASRDIYPFKTQFHLNTIPEGLPIYAEGDLYQSDYTVASVVGLTRTISVLRSAVKGDSIYVFNRWSDDSTGLSRAFTVPDDTLSFTALYDAYPLGKGQGLTGYYYDGPAFDPTFNEPPEFIRIDTTINFDWEGGSPSADLLGDDFWLVRWQGYIEPLFTGTYTFYIVADDGTRLWIGADKVIDAWIPQPPTEWSGTIELEAGNLYPITLEFFEEGGGALCEFYWSSDLIAKSIVQQTQLYLESSTAVQPVSNDNSSLKLFPNPVKNLLYAELREAQNEFKHIEIQNAVGQIIFQKSASFTGGRLELPISHLPKGTYWFNYELIDGRTGSKGFVKM